MTRAVNLLVTRSESTAELEAMLALKEVRQHGGYVLLDIDGCVHVRHIARVPVELCRRLALYYPEVVRLLAESVQ